MTGNILFMYYSFISIAVPSIMAYLFWKRRGTAGAVPMSILMLCELEWSAVCFLSAINSNIEQKLFLNSLSFIAAAIMPVIWLIFSIRYTNQEKYSKKYYYPLLFIIPTITLVIMFTNNLHNLFITDTLIQALPNSDLLLVSYKFGILFWVHAIYAYLMLLLGAIILVIKLVSSFKIFQKQALLMVGALIVSFSGEIIYQLGLGPFNNMLITPFTFSVGAVLLFISMFHYKALDLVPIAREAVIETMDDLVIVMDNQNRIIDANRAARRIFYKEYKILVGQPITNILKNLPSLADKTTLNQNSHSEIMLEIENKPVYYNVKLSPLYNKQKAIIGSFVILMDITDLYEIIDKLEKAKQLAESANKAKSDFLATMSHEIRTPINGIVGMAELLENANLNPQERENLKALQYSAEVLLHLINEILDFSKIEAGKMEIESTPFNPREILQSTTKTFDYNNKNNSITFVLSVDEKIPDNLLGDYIKLRQIITNLLSNAFKFTEAGEIRLEVSYIRSCETEVLLGFCVTDTGIGMPADKIESLFQSFQQLDSSTTRKYGGTGLGLSIVKKLIELMGGYIKAESQEGRGSRFYFELPFKVHDSSTDKEYIAEVSAALEPKALKILVAEDSKVNQMLISQLLSKKNWTADIVENGMEALQKLQDNIYDLVLMDIQMPVMDGYQAAKHIRADEQSKGTHIPIIALTANATQEDRAKSLEHGMDDFLSKPIKSDKLYECILKHTSI